MTVAKQTWNYDQRIHALPYGGKSKFLARSAALTTGGSRTTLLTTPDGQVALIDTLVMATQADNLTPTTDPLDYLVLTLLDADSVIRSQMPIVIASVQSSLLTPTSPLGFQPQSQDPIVWRPQAPLMVPSGWTLMVQQRDLGGGATPTSPNTDFTHDTHKVQVYGILVGEDDARGAGYDVNSSGAQSSRNWIQTGSFLEVFSPDQGFSPGTELTPRGDGSSNSATGFVPARTNNSILITDLLVRLAPVSAAGASGISLRQTDGTVIFEWFNSVVSQPVTRIIRPRIYCEPGVGLEIACIGSPAEDRSSVILLGRYVPSDLVPTDCWWGNVQPPFPSGGVESPDTVSQSFTLNYPTGSPAGSFDTRISPGEGLEHVLEGYEISVQKSSEIDTGPVIFSLGTGVAAGTGLVANVGTALPLTGINWIAKPGQNLTYGVDKVAIPCQPDNGLLALDVDRSAALYASPGTDAGIENWSFTVWGRTRPASHRATGGDLTQLKGTN